MLRIYGCPTTRAFRVIWTAEELGLPYEIVRIDYRECARHPGLLALHSLGKVPVIDDDGFVLSESLAIMTYLVQRHGGGLTPVDAQAEARALQWTLWGAAEMDEALVDLIHFRRMQAPGQEDEWVARLAESKLPRSVAYLDAHLGGNTYLLGDTFSLADLCVSSVMYSAWYNRAFDFRRWPRVVGWIERCLSRPAALRARSLRELPPAAI